MTQLSVGDKVQRKVSCPYYSDEVGVIVEIDSDTGRARIKWEDKRTWYKLTMLKTL
jgi:hypothetical protein